MVSTRINKHHSIKLLGQLDEFDQDIFIDDAVSSGRQNLEVGNGQQDFEFTSNKNNGMKSANENVLNIQTAERNLTAKL